MNFLSIKEAMKKGSGKVAVRGWVHRERGSNKMKFIILRDSSDIIQIVLDRKDFEKQWNEIDSLQIESSLEIIGEIKKDERAQNGYEIKAKKLKIINLSHDFPINKSLNEELLGDRRHLWLRSRKMIAIMKIRDTVLSTIREHWRKKGFYEFNTPSIIGTQCEGGSSLFKVDYFGKELYLAQTWQLHAEPGIFGLEKIFTIQPSFRAEKSKTSRHLTEYWHAEMEVAWENFEYLQNDAEELVKEVVKTVLEKNKGELETLKRDKNKLTPTIKKKFPRISYTESLKILKNKSDMAIKWAKDLRTIEEDKLSELYETPIIITDYPKKVKAFYMKESEKHPKEGKTVLGFDMIGPEKYGELIGASQREENIQKLKENLKVSGENPEKYEFYFDTRRYGSVPHGGYGLGVERLVAWICGLSTVKDAIPYPRTMTRFYP